MTIIDILKEKFIYKEIVITSPDKSSVTGILTDVYSGGDKYHDIIVYIFNYDHDNYGSISSDDNIKIVGELIEK